MKPCRRLATDPSKLRLLTAITNPGENTASAMVAEHLSQKLIPTTRVRALVTTTILITMKRNSMVRDADLAKTQGVRRFVLLARLSRAQEQKSANLPTRLSQKVNL